MMTLEEAIKHCKDIALSCTNKECALEHFQLLKWLQEYSNMLEKQGEQKPAWSKEDENLFRCAIDAVREESKVRTDGCLDEEVGEMVTNWLKSLKDRVLPQSKQEWSEEDEICYTSIMVHLKDSITYTSGRLTGWIDNRVKSLRPQSTWKPSDEQMNGLKEAIEFLGCTKTRREQLQSLYEQLKKLREE